jgi:hypothetical protein
MGLALFREKQVTTEFRMYFFAARPRGPCGECTVNGPNLPTNPVASRGAVVNREWNALESSEEISVAFPELYFESSNRFRSPIRKHGRPGIGI